MPRVVKKNLNKEEAIRDISAFSALDGDEGDRIIEYLCLKFDVFRSGRSKTEFEAGYDEGARAVINYMDTLRLTYQELKQKLEVTNG